MVVLLDARDFGVVVDQVIDLLLEGLGNHVHAANRLEDAALEFVLLAAGDALPQIGIQQRLAVDRLGRHRLRHQAATVVYGEATTHAGLQGLFVGIVRVQRAPFTHHFQQAFAVFPGQRLIQAVLIDRLAQQLGHMPLKVGLYLTIALRLAIKGLGGMDHRVVVDLDKGFQGDAEFVAVIEHGMMVIWDAPRAGVEVQALVKFAMLGSAPQLGETVTAPQRPAAPARLGIELQHLDLVAGLAQFVGSGHAGQSCAEDQDASALGRAAQGKITLII